VTLPDHEGWTFPEQLAWLSERAATRYRILEVGAWKGRTTAVLADATPGKVWVVDNWRPTDPEDDATLEVEAQGREAVFDAFLTNMRPWASRLVVLDMDARHAWSRLGHLLFDMVWLDGDHRYEETADAIRHARGLLAPGGLLCGHDGEHDGVRRAVDELVPGAQFHETMQPAPYGPSLIWYSDGLE
jgi:SAM-dependent methyltransferase